MITDYHPTLLIPADQPNKRLVQLIKTLRKLRPKQRIIVVVHGSAIKKPLSFSKISNFNIELLNQNEDQEKNQALKTGFKHWLETTTPKAAGIVTANANGKHIAQDILQLSDVFMQKPTCLLQANQNGLHAIPRKLTQLLLDSKTSDYDFELEMLSAAKDNQIAIEQATFNTPNNDVNNKSYLNPAFDSIKVYFVFLRFVGISFFSSTIDFIVFTLTYWTKKNIFLAIILGRILSATFSFKLNQNLAFKSKNKLWSTAIKYASLASFLALIAYNLIMFIYSFGINVYTSKIIAEVSLFIISFTIQRLFIFNKID